LFSKFEARYLLSSSLVKILPVKEKRSGWKRLQMKESFKDGMG